MLLGDKLTKVLYDNSMICIPMIRILLRVAAKFLVNVSKPSWEELT